MRTATDKMNDAQKKLPGRPRKDLSERAADRRALVDAAFVVLREGGPPAFTARGIATRAGTAVGSVYTSFASLEALRLEVNAVTLGLLHEHLAAALARSASGTTEDRLIGLADSYVDFAHAHRLVWKALFEPSTVPAPPANAQAIAGLFALLEQVLHGSGRMDAADVPVLARALWSSVHGTVYLAETGSLGPVGRDDAPAMIRALVHAIVRGLA